MGRWLIVAGLIILGLGIIVQFAPWLISWFGKLPGDIRIESGRTKIFIPITSMILLSVVLTLLVSLFRR
jgi:hypothetical protein